MRIVMFGATRGCGLEALLYLVNNHQSETPVEIYCLARNEKSFSAVLEERLQDGGAKEDRLGKVHIVSGDALDTQGVERFLTQVAKGGHIDYILSSLGTLPVFNLWKPFAPVKMAPGQENICGQSMDNILNACKVIAPSYQKDAKAPTLFVVSSNAIGKSAHDVLPSLLTPIYGPWLKHPHHDKRNMEVLLHESYGIHSSDFNNTAYKVIERADSIFDPSKLVIVRPSLLTNSKANSSIRSSSSPMPGAYFISRKSVGEYLAKRMLGNEQVKTSPWQGGIVLSN